MVAAAGSTASDLAQQASQKGRQMTGQEKSPDETTA
jgi:hypothetical protein